MLWCYNRQYTTYCGSEISSILKENARGCSNGTTWIKKDGKVAETLQDMFRRVANNIARPKRSVPRTKACGRQVFEMMTALDFLPISPLMTPAGSCSNWLPVSSCLWRILKIYSIPSSMLPSFTEWQRNRLSFSACAQERPCHVHRRWPAVSSFMKVFNSATRNSQAGGPASNMACSGRITLTS